MSNPYYPALMSPLRIRRYILKNRMGLPRSIPTNFFGYGSYPLESIARYLGMQAGNGAAVVTAPSPHWNDPNSRGSFLGMGEMGPPKKQKRDPETMMLGNPDAYDAMPISEMLGADITKANVRAVFSRAAAAVRAQDSIPAISMMEIEPNGWKIDDIPAEYLDRMCVNFARAAQLYRDIGFSQGCFYHNRQSTTSIGAAAPHGCG